MIAQDDHRWHSHRYHSQYPPALARELQIETIAYYVHRGLETLRDMIDVQPEPFARYLAQTNRLPTTS